MARRVRHIAVLGLLGCCLAAPACYERVVGAKGIGAAGVDISEPNAPAGSGTKIRTQKKTVKLKDAPSR